MKFKQWLEIAVNQPAMNNTGQPAVAQTGVNPNDPNQKQPDKIDFNDFTRFGDLAHSRLVQGVNQEEWKALWDEFMQKKLREPNKVDQTLQQQAKNGMQNIQTMMNQEPASSQPVQPAGQVQPSS
jgi:hypothetical protein